MERTADEIGLGFDYAASRRGDGGGPGRRAFKALAGRIAAWAAALPRSPLGSITRRWTRYSQTVAVRTDVAPVDATVRIDGTEPTVVPARTGLALDRQKAAQLILAASLADEPSGRCSRGTDAIDVTDAEAEAARDVALQMLSGPVDVDVQGKTWTFESDDIAKWISVSPQRRHVDRHRGEFRAGVAGRWQRQRDLLAYVSPQAAGKSVVPAVGAKVGQPAKTHGSRRRADR